ncbi:hypothetical protein KEG38_35575 [Polyangium jinanense]|uniref:RCC1-like domain-containing protein n=2 Tax=Polyangium jinanense TaxID=2829994 RepID=A0A9X4AWU1_9BACT|nr:hypothetical protein [Polyangium jinanense]MDC3987679.1 hypothetical protein [Polyangium jinanense]
MGAGGDGGGQAARPSSEGTAEAQAALTAGAGSLGTCDGNPARCAAVNVAVGFDHTVALKSDGTVWAWGWNGNGQLGDGTTLERHTAVQVSGLGGVIAVAAGASYTVALKSDGTVWAWGFNQFGQLGDGTTTERHTPVQVSGLGGVAAVATGRQHTVALKSDGTVWAWGWNSYGQLGDGTNIDKLTPGQVGGLIDVTAVVGGGYHTVALKSDGTVWAWGENSHGGLGDGTTTYRDKPVQVIGLSGVTAVAAGVFHSVALKSDGTLWAWGWNGPGQLGDGTSIERHTPVQVIGLNNVTAVVGGEDHTVAVRSNGTVWTWGRNDSGQLGDGTTNNRSTPLQLVAPTGFAAVAAGPRHTVALKSDGTVWAWGWNNEGELGDGTILDKLTPVQTSGLNLSPECGAMAACNAGTGLCAAVPGPNGTACDDGNACTQTDTCEGGMCVGGNELVCPPVGECEVGLCNAANGVCSAVPKPDDTPCASGVCLAGVCEIEATTSSTSATGTGGGGGGSSSTGTGGGGGGGGGSSTGTGGGGGGSSSTGTGGMMETSSTTGAGGDTGENPSSESGCGACVVGSGSANGAPWIGLGLLLVLRRKRKSLAFRQRSATVAAMRSLSRFLPRALLAVSLGCLPGCLDLIRGGAELIREANAPEEDPAKPEPAAAAKEPKKPKESSFPVVAAPYQRRILFANKSLKADASNASIAIDTWTLGDPLYIHAYGGPYGEEAPKYVVLYAEVNGEPAACADNEIIQGADFGALGRVELHGDSITPVQGGVGPQAFDTHMGMPASVYAGVWANNLKSDRPWARTWEEFHKRIIPMLHVGDNTLKLTLADEKRTEIFAEGTVTIKVPSEAAFKAELSANVETSESGDPATLREIDKLVRAHSWFRDLRIVRVSYVLDKWRKEYEGREVVRAIMNVDVIFRKTGDKFPARCRVRGVVAARNAEGSPETKFGKIFLDSYTLETRWTPCP